MTDVSRNMSTEDRKDTAQSAFDREFGRLIQSVPWRTHPQDHRYAVAETFFTGGYVAAQAESAARIAKLERALTEIAEVVLICNSLYSNERSAINGVISRALAGRGVGGDDNNDSR